MIPTMLNDSEENTLKFHYVPHIIIVIAGHKQTPQLNIKILFTEGEYCILI